MERLRLRNLLKGSKGSDPIDYVHEVALALLEGRVMGEEVLFRDAVNEIYITLRDAITEKRLKGEDKEKILRAYELAVILRYLVHDGVKTSREILEELVQILG